jgi:DNA repair protein RadC
MNTLLVTDKKRLRKSASYLSLLADIADLRQEHVVVIILDVSRLPIATRTVFIGSLTSSIIHPREIFATAIAERAASIVIAHNHPSGSPEPSQADMAVTQQLIAGGVLLGIPVVDHIIVAGKKHYSFLANGLILPP